MSSEFGLRRGGRLFVRNLPLYGRVSNAPTAWCSHSANSFPVRESCHGAVVEQQRNPKLGKIVSPRAAESCVWQVSPSSGDSYEPPRTT